MGRRKIQTRQQIFDHLDKMMLEKGLDKEEPQKGGLLFKWYMMFPEGQRPGVVGLANMYKINRHQMRTFIERWERNL